MYNQNRGRCEGAEGAALALLSRTDFAKSAGKAQEQLGLGKLVELIEGLGSDGVFAQP